MQFTVFCQLCLLVTLSLESFVYTLWRIMGSDLEAHIFQNDVHHFLGALYSILEYYVLWFSIIKYLWIIILACNDTVFLFWWFLRFPYYCCFGDTLLWIMGEVEGEGLWLLPLLLVTRDTGHVTCDKWHMTFDIWHLKIYILQQKRANKSVKGPKSVRTRGFIVLLLLLHPVSRILYAGFFCLHIGKTALESQACILS